MILGADRKPQPLTKAIPVADLSKGPRVVCPEASGHNRGPACVSYYYTPIIHCVSDKSRRSAGSALCAANATWSTTGMA